LESIEPPASVEQPDGSQSNWLSEADIGRFSGEVRAILADADKLRNEQRKDRVYTEHIVFALWRLDGQLPRLAAALNVDLSAVLKRDFGVSIQSPIEFKGLPPISNNVRGSLRTARDKADELRSKTIEDSHLLYGVLSQSASAVVEELNKLGITPDRVTFPPAQTSEEASKSNSADEPPSAHIATDSWTVDDKLGHSGYARAIYRFITDEKTDAPLAISIQAPWGGGKTSLMRMVQKELDPKAVEKLEQERTRRKDRNKGVPNTIAPGELKKELGASALRLRGVIKEIRQWRKSASDERVDNPCVPPTATDDSAKHRFTVWFNAWKYQSTEQVWAGLGDCILRGVTDRMSVLERQRFWLQLQFSRLDTEKIQRQIFERVLSEWWRIARPWILGTVVLILVFLATALGGLHWTGIGGTLVCVVVGLLNQIRLYVQAKTAVEDEPAELSLSEYLQVPDYRGHTGFIHEVAEDLNRVMNAISPSELPIVLFIDDLDRCSPQKVAEVTVGINLFLAGEFPDCIFVFGMDAEMVAAALEKAHSDVIGKLPSYATGIPIGWRFMDKFVQLPFVIPPPEKEDLETYIQSLLQEEAVRQSIPQTVQGRIDQIVSARDPEAASKLTNQISDFNLTDAQEREVVFRLEQVKRLAEIDAEIDRASHDAKAVRDFVMRVAPDLYRNPRDLKRFLNTFRLHDFLRIAQETRSLPAPSRELIADWIRLSLRWPQVVRWMQRVPGSEGSEAGGKNGTGSLHFRLCQLEDCAREAPDIGAWTQKLNARLGPSVKNVEWVSDPALFEFFSELSKRPEPQRLSYGAGKGLW